MVNLLYFVIITNGDTGKKNQVNHTKNEFIVGIPAAVVRLVLIIEVQDC